MSARIGALFTAVATTRESGEHGGWTTPTGDGGVVLAQVRCQPGGADLALVLAAIDPPTSTSAADAEAYCSRIAAGLAARAPGAAASVAILRATDRGLAGWVAGGVWIARLGRTVEMVVLPATIEALGRTLLASGAIATGPFGGRTIAIEGRRFAIVVANTMLSVGPAAFGDVEGVPERQLLRQVGASLATEGSQKLLAAWSLDREERREVDLQAGSQRGGLGFAHARIGIEPASDLSLASELDDDALPAALREAFFAGARDAFAATPGAGARLTILSALVHPVDATAARFRELGARAVAAARSDAPVPPPAADRAVGPAPLERTVVFARTGDVTHPYEAMVDGAKWQLRLGDFPAEPLYTLVIDGVVHTTLEQWPARWSKS